MIEDYIPAGLRQRLVASNLSAGTASIAGTLYEHFRLSGLPFFREYTDHSFQHSIDVFKSATDMVPDSALEIVSADDINVLLLASLVHDSGLSKYRDDVWLSILKRNPNWRSEESRSRAIGETPI